MPQDIGVIHTPGSDSSLMSRKKVTSFCRGAILKMCSWLLNADDGLLGRTLMLQDTYSCCLTPRECDSTVNYVTLIALKV